MKRASAVLEEPVSVPVVDEAECRRRRVCLTVSILPEIFLNSISDSTIRRDSYLLRLPWALMTIPDRDRRMLLRTPEWRFAALAAIDWTDPATIERLCGDIEAQQRPATN